jgi:hypothetical protein
MAHEGAIEITAICDIYKFPVNPFLKTQNLLFFEYLIV